MKARDSQTGTFKDVYVKALDGNPIGTILPYSKSTAPTGYMICDGSAISRTTYAELFSIIGTTFGSGDGSTTFNIPNLKGRVPVGYDSTQTEFDTLGETGGEKTHTLTIAEMPSHDHNVANPSITYSNLVLMAKAPNKQGLSQNGSGSGDWEWNRGVPAQGGGQAHNNLQPYLVLNYIIKVSQTRPLSATVVNEYNDSQVNAYSTEYVNTKIGEIQTELGGLIKTQKFSRTVNMGANTRDYWQFSGISIPTGYKYLGILQNKCGEATSWLTSWHCGGANGDKIYAQVYNFGSQLTRDIECTVVYIKDLS